MYTITDFKGSFVQETQEDRIHLPVSTSKQIRYSGPIRRATVHHFKSKVLKDMSEGIGPIEAMAIEMKENLHTLYARESHISEREYEKLVHLCPNLSHLILDGAHVNEQILLNISKLSNLVHLNLNNVIGVSSVGIKAILKNCSNLRELDISGSKTANEDILDIIDSEGNNLTFLRICHYSGTGFDKLARFFEKPLEFVCYLDEKPGYCLKLIKHTDGIVYTMIMSKLSMEQDIQEGRR